MALLQDLIQQIDDPALKERILQETNKLLKQKKFGLVFEEHLPECTPLYDVPIRVGSKVALKTGYVSDIYTVMKIDDDEVLCDRRETHEQKTFQMDEIVAIAEFGEPIYPTLKPIDIVENAPDSDLWHTLIEAENYHALQLLEYLYAEKVDCIYIDPPYNTGAKDWKYNNDYVDSSDAYRHSKWLSMMEKRLRIAKKLLNPNDSVLIVTIDEKEYLHLGCLLEELFPEATIQMVSSVINPKGAARHQQFGRTDEYLFFVQFGVSSPEPLPLTNEWKISEDKRASRLRWKELLRSGSHTARTDSPNQFYPVFINNTDAGPVFHSVGESYYGTNTSEIVVPDGCVAVWPIRADGTEGNWQISSENLKASIDIGYAKLGNWRGEKTAITYLAKGEREKIAKGAFTIIGHRQDGSVITDDDAYIPKFIPGTQWRIKSHNAEQGGTNLLKEFFGSSRFTFPKSLYAVHDTIRFFVANKPNALIIDFFAGSGTTLHAVNLLNAEDGGCRRCICVTNNELRKEESDALTEQGFKPGDSEWERLGIAKYVAWPRIECSIKGHDINGNFLGGEYTTYKTSIKEKDRNIVQIGFVRDVSSLKIGEKKRLVSILSNKKLPQTLVSQETKYIVSDETKHTVTILLDDTAGDEWLEALDGMNHITDFYIITSNNRIFKSLKARIKDMFEPILIQSPVVMPMKDGFKANCEYFKLGFLDKTSVALGRQFRELLPVLWMKGNAIGKCPVLENDNLPNMMILPKNKMAILVDEIYYSEFDAELSQHPEIQTVFIVTDSETAYRSMIRTYDGKDCYQLYRNYLDNFRINTGR
nr:DNA methyltransferase [uncultured Megasphaera sp.]